MPRPITVRRSGVFSQLFFGKPSFANRPPRIFEDFSMSVLALSDTSADSHRALESLKKVETDDGKLEVKTGSSALRIENDKNWFTYAFGIGPFNMYYRHGKAPKEDTNFYEFFSGFRLFIFGIFKFADYIIRSPALVFAAGQILLERIGWKLQVLYKKTDNPALKFFAMLILGVPGFFLNAIGSIVLGFGLYICKVLAEAIRLPLAILGGAAGLVFGGVVSLFQKILTIAPSSNYAEVKSVSNSIFQGMVDGIRPFAPEFANEILRIWLQTEMGKPTVRWPFQKASMIASNGEIQKDTIISPHWLPIAMLIISVIAVSILGTMNIGMDKPILQHLFDLSKIAEGGKGPFGNFTFMKLNAELSITTYVTFGLMAVGGLKAALVGFVRGFQALVYDLMYAEGVKKPPDQLIPTSAAEQNQNIEKHQSSQHEDGLQPSNAVVTYIAPEVVSSINSSENKHNTKGMDNTK